MIQEKIYIDLKDGSQVELLSPPSSEAQPLLDAMIKIATHSPYILSTPESFKQKDLAGQVKWLEDSAASDFSIIIAAYDNQKIIGFCSGRSYSDVKRRHRAALGIALDPYFRGQGLGKKMMDLLITRMKNFSGIKIIELEVMINNLPAIKMYENLGFKKAGIFPQAFILANGEVSDNLTMYLEV